MGRPLREIEEGGLQHCFIEMSACKGSCVGGPAMHQSHSRTPVANMAKVERFVGRAPGDFDLPGQRNAGSAQGSAL